MYALKMICLVASVGLGVWLFSYLLDAPPEDEARPEVPAIIEPLLPPITTIIESPNVELPTTIREAPPVPSREIALVPVPGPPPPPLVLPPTIVTILVPTDPPPPTTETTVVVITPTQKPEDTDPVEPEPTEEPEPTTTTPPETTPEETVTPTTTPEETTTTTEPTPSTEPPVEDENGHLICVNGQLIDGLCVL